MLDAFHGLALLKQGKSRAISPENPTGEPGRGGTATEGTGAKRAAHLGQGWKISPALPVSAGETKVLADISGEGVIQSMWFSDHQARQVILRIYWDGQEHPSVECPLMEFFAYSWRHKTPDPFKGPFFQLSSLPVAVNPNRGFNCFWPMPFKKRCLVTLENRTESDMRCFYQINYSLESVPDGSAYFHAHFRRTNPVPYMQDHVIIDGIEGKGHYVGTALFVGLNGMNNWWGEGEVKFFIDDDTDFPTICGTGTEDYFGGCYDWDVDGEYTTYTTPFMGMHQLIQPDGLYQVQQRFSMYRWHIVDPIRFEKRIRVTIQDLGWEIQSVKYRPRTDDFSSTAYWYQTLPSKPFGRFPANEDLIYI